MRNLFLTFCAFIYAASSFGQGQIDVPYKKREDDKIIVNINYDTWQDYPEEIELRPVSIGFDFANYYDFKFGRTNFSFGLGWGISSHNVHHNGQFVDSTNDNARYTHLIPLKNDFKKNKFAVNYLDFPVELRFKSATKKTIRIAIGAKGGWHIGNHVKIIDDQGKRKYYGIPNINSYHYGLTGRIGYGDINFSLFYSMTSIFEESYGPDLKQLSIGFSIIPF